MSENEFVGRNKELQQLAGFLGRASAGYGQVVFVAGEAGAGKSTLVNQFVRRAQGDDASLIAAGECNAQSGAGDPYLPFRQVLATLSGGQESGQPANTINAANAERLGGVVRVAAETLLDLGPDLIGVFLPGASLAARLASTAAKHAGVADRVASRIGATTKAAVQQPVDPTANQEHIFEEYARVLQALASAHTLILILDDLHWADSGSLNLLFHLARDLRESRVLLVGTYRPDDVVLGRDGGRHPLAPLLNELKRYYGDIVIDLGANQASEARSFVDSLLDQEPNHLDESFREQLLARTEGHPLFVVELLRGLKERSYLIKDNTGAWVQGPTMDWSTVPARVEGVIAERIGRLDESAREVAAIGSVMGYEFYAQVIGRVQGANERDIMRQLTRDLDKRHQLVVEEGETQIGGQFLSLYRFAHALFQQFLYDDLSAGERRIFHGEVAASLEELCEGHTDEIAVQLARHYREAHNDAKAFTYSVQSGDEAARIYAYPEARAYYSQALDALVRLPDSEENRRHRVTTLIKQVSVSLRADGPQKSIQRMKEAEALAQTLPGTDGQLGSDQLLLARIYYWMGHAYLHGGDPQQAVRYMNQVLVLAQDSGDVDLLAVPNAVVGRALVIQGQFAQSEQLLARAATMLEQVENWPDWAFAVAMRGVDLANMGDPTAGRQACERGLARAQQIRSLTAVGQTNFCLALSALEAGDSELMLSASTAAIEAGEQAGDHLIIAFGHGYRAWALSRLARYAESERDWAELKRIADSIGGRVAFSEMLQAAHAEGLVGAGRPIDACAAAEQALTLAQEVGGSLSAALAHRAWGRALAALDSLEHPADVGEVDLHFAESVRLADACQARIESARTRLAWGEILVARHATDQARVHLVQAVAQFASSGVESDLAQAQALLATLP